MTLVRPGMTDAEARAAIEADPIALEIMWSRLTTVVDEMWLTIIRTAFSLIIAESQDFACELLDPTGETLAHSPRAMPVFNLTLPRAVKALLARFPVETLQPGDMLITNDPWLCAGHLFDLAVVSPVFRDGRVVALVGTVGHVADIGGTRDSLRAREIFDEGLQIPPMKLARAGVDNEDLFAIIAENVRNPSQVIGDIQAFMSANRIGAQRLLSFMAEYGLADLRALAAHRDGPGGARHARRDPGAAGRCLSQQRLTQPGRRRTDPAAEADGCRRYHRPRFRRRAATACDRRRQLDNELHRGARDLSAEMHADPECARQCRLLPPVHRAGAGRLDPELHPPGGRRGADPHRLVSGARGIPRPGGCRAGHRCSRRRACRSPSLSRA